MADPILSTDDEALVSAVETAENALLASILSTERATGLNRAHLCSVIYDHRMPIADRLVALRSGIALQRLRQSALRKLSVEERSALGVRVEVTEEKV